MTEKTGYFSGLFRLLGLFVGFVCFSCVYRIVN